VVLDLRLYRLTLLPFAVLLIVAAFSLHAAPGVPATAPPAQTFDVTTAASAMQALAASYPDRSPGSAGDDALAAELARPGGEYTLAGPGVSVRVVSSSVETTSGAASVRTVLASRAGAAGGAGIALIADRGGSQSGAAALAPTATLLELALIYRELLPQRPLTLVSTSGGASAMGAVAALLPPDTEAAIVIGDVTDASGRGPYVVPWSASGGLAPIQLRRTVEAAVAFALSRPVGDPALSEQMARIALPLTPGAQGLLDGAGVPTVLVSADGESAPAAAAGRPDVSLMGEFGQALLGVTTALDGFSTLPTAPTRDLAFGTQVLSGWAVRAVIGALLLSLIGCTLDVLARTRRRRIAVARWNGWTLSFAAPFLLAGLFAAFLGASGLLPATPAAAVTPAQLPVSGEAAAALVSIGLLFVLVWVLRTAVLARAGRRERPDPVGAVAALLIVTTVTATLLWFENPYSATLLILPAHLWLVVLTREHERSPALGALCVVISLAPLAAVLALICSVLHVEPFALLWTTVLLIAGGGLSASGLVLASLAAGSFVAAAALLLRRNAIGPDQRLEVTVRGPLSYAGPGSLGGTESALRR
jgi:hypothetical protein